MRHVDQKGAEHRLAGETPGGEREHDGAANQGESGQRTTCRVRRIGAVSEVNQVAQRLHDEASAERANAEEPVDAILGAGGSGRLMAVQ